MENKINFVFMLSLKEIAMRNVVVNLWNLSDVLVSIENFCKHSPHEVSYSEEWHEAVETKILDKLSKLVPVALSKQMLFVVRPIGLQILKWKYFHEFFLTSKDSVKFDAPVLEKLHWTVAGMIDYRQTAEELIRCKMLDITKTYQLACLYCLEDCIPNLWKELSYIVKRKIKNYRKISYIQNEALPYIWPYILRGKEYKLDRLIHRRNIDQTSLNQVASIESIIHGNKCAMEYFFQKLPKDEKNIFDLTKQALVEMTKYSFGDFPLENYGNVLCYLLSEMSYEEQMEIIQSHPIAVLTGFLEWPWQDVFLKIANLVWGSFSEEQHYALLSSMFDVYNKSNYANPMLFQKCYIPSPVDFKKCFVNFGFGFQSFLAIFLDNQDSETIEIVLRISDSADRLRLVSCEGMFRSFYFSILKGKCEIVEVCLREARLSEDDKMSLKDHFVTINLLFGDGKQTKKDEEVWMKFFQILDSKDEELGK